MTLRARAWKFAGPLLCIATAVNAATCGSELKGARAVESANYTVAYRFVPPKIAVGSHFALEAVACGRNGAAAPAALAVDAFMPDHGHGMNYKATVKRIGATKSGGTQFRADGLMFHMPGKWDLYFDVPGTGKSERLTQSVMLD